MNYGDRQLLVCNRNILSKKVEVNFASTTFRVGLVSRFVFFYDKQVNGTKLRLTSNIVNEIFGDFRAATTRAISGPIFAFEGFEGVHHLRMLL